MRIAYWIPKATNTHSEYVILIAFPLIILRRLNVPLHAHSLCSYVTVGTVLLPDANSLCSPVPAEGHDKLHFANVWTQRIYCSTQTMQLASRRIPFIIFNHFHFLSYDSKSHVIYFLTGNYISFLSLSLGIF